MKTATATVKPKFVFNPSFDIDNEAKAKSILDMNFKGEKGLEELSYEYDLLSESIDKALESHTELIILGEDIIGIVYDTLLSNPTYSHIESDYIKAKLNAYLEATNVPIEEPKMRYAGVHESLLNKAFVFDMSTVKGNGLISIVSTFLYYYIKDRNLELLKETPIKTKDKDTALFLLKNGVPLQVLPTKETNESKQSNRVHSNVDVITVPAKK